MRILAIAMAAMLAAATARAAPPPLEAYARDEAISAIAISPSGQRLAVAVRNPAGGWNVIVRTTQGAPVGAFGYKMSRIEGLEFAGDDHLLVFEEQRAPLPGYFYLWGYTSGEYDRRDISAINLQTRTSFLLVECNNRQATGFISWHGAREIGGRWYGFASAGPLTHDALLRLDLDACKFDEVTEAARYGSRAWLLDGSGFLLGSWGQDVEKQQDIFYPPPASKASERRQTDPDELRLLGAGRTSGTVLLFERTGGLSRFREISATDGGEGTVLAEGEAALSALYEPSTRLLAGFSSLYDQRLFDPALQKRLEDARQPFAQQAPRLAAHSSGFAQMAFWTEGPGNPGRAWFVDSVAKKAIPIGDLRPDIAPDELAPTRMFEYRSADGLALEGVLTLPPHRDARRLPLIVVASNSALGSATRPGFHWLAQALASRGYAVLEPNGRGRLGYGDAFRNAIFGEFGGKSLSDLSDGVAALAASGVVDPKRVCIFGSFDGGFAAAAGVTLQHGVYRCAVSASGLSDLDRQLVWIRGRTSFPAKVRYQNLWRRLTGRELDAMSPISPAAAAGSADAPLLLIDAKDGSGLFTDQNARMESALRKAGKAVERLQVAGPDAWGSTEAGRQTVLTAALAFVQKHNPAD
jgi:hypothetical protein